MPRIRFIATFTGTIDIDPNDEHWLRPAVDSKGHDLESFDPFDLAFALEVAEDDFRDDPEGFSEEHSDGADVEFAPVAEPSK